MDEKYHFSFHTDDSFEAIDDGPMLKPVRPEFVPMLDLNGLPGYETSSDEDEGEEQYVPPQQQHYQSQGLPSAEQHQSNPVHYEESMKYIQDFYDKYHQPSDPNSVEPHSRETEFHMRDEIEDHENS